MKLVKVKFDNGDTIYGANEVQSVIEVSRYLIKILPVQRIKIESLTYCELPVTEEQQKTFHTIIISVLETVKDADDLEWFIVEVIYEKPQFFNWRDTETFKELVEKQTLKMISNRAALQLIEKFIGGKLPIEVDENDTLKVTPEPMPKKLEPDAVDSWLANVWGSV